MRVKNLTITNFRGFEGAHHFELGRKFQVIAGINGRGKTAMLDALALLASRLLPLIAPARSGYRAIRSSEVHGAEDRCELAMEVLCANIPVRFAVRYTRGNRRTVPTDVSPAVRKEVRSAYGDPTRPDDAAALAVYYTTDRAGFRLPKSLPARLPDAKQSLAYVGALQNRMVDYRDLLPRLRHWQRDRRYERSVDALNRALANFFEGIGGLQVEEAPPRLTVAKGTHRLALDRLSDGERAVLAIVTDLVRRLSLANPEESLDPLLGAGVVLIDEIELHLHPRWQREIVGKLRTTFPNMQFVATTHSPFVIQSLQPGELVNLDPDEFGDYANKSIEDISENVMGVDLPQKSVRYRRMMDAAEAYFRLLRAPAPAEPIDVAALEARLSELSMPFSDDPAFQALLKLEREAVVQERRDASGS